MEWRSSESDFIKNFVNKINQYSLSTTQKTLILEMILDTNRILVKLGLTYWSGFSYYKQQLLSSSILKFPWPKVKVEIDQLSRTHSVRETKLERSRFFKPFRQTSEV